MKKLFYTTMAVCFLLFQSCKKSDMNKWRGSVVFYTTSNTHGNITLTIKNATFVIPVTTNPDSYCTNGWTGYVALDEGTYTYKATAAGGMQWNGSVNITKDNCLKQSLQ